MSFQIVKNFEINSNTSTPNNKTHATSKHYCKECNFASSTSMEYINSLQFNCFSVNPTRLYCHTHTIYISTFGAWIMQKHASNNAYIIGLCKYNAQRFAQCNAIVKLGMNAADKKKCFRIPQHLQQKILNQKHTIAQKEREQTNTDVCLANIIKNCANRTKCNSTKVVFIECDLRNA